ncbi:bifunctional serine/threonine-protein kinase/ABC transporter substrate-binding protein [Streptomyces sp. NPDC058001]|uniref:bifunctional serine/threonine-protein kinase/ABC transporter substrate-binding protein n=1 Tax=Streptomyces sp. NPDC058001 TaxID=3346300 RepID=UPI0036E50416
MRALKGTDPEVIGGHRLLARLGAGGMGVVYLARSEGGALVALKSIRPEYAADPGFRARFRREVEIARRLTGRWVVPVTAADAEARAPWLATGFISGPALAEAVAELGPLPYPAVRALGARLARALAEVHAAGLVHRDVKPGNVLLALDGPRLIDFGIARAADATALTATDAVIGTPGYLAPEQARSRGAGGEVGPPSDVFALGCVLAYAATGRRPFGTGAAAAVMFRTVHEEPDLAGMPDELRPVLERCLAKDPATRPTADQLATELGPLADDTDWLPPGLTALIAERSSRVLDLPEPGPRTEDIPSVTDATPMGRRRFLTLASAAGVVAAGGGTAAWFAARGGGGGDAGGAGAGRDLPECVIGLHGDLSGPGKAAGRAQERGARLAVAAYNARRNRAVRLTLRVVDDRGDPDRAVKVAGQLGADEKVYAVIGPTSDATALAARVPYKKAQLPMLTVWAGDPYLYQNTYPNVFQLRPPHPSLGGPTNRFLTRVRPSERTAVLDDQTDEPASWQLAKVVTDAPPSGGTVSVHRVASGSGAFDKAIADAVRERAQGLLFCGTSPRRAALCAKAVRDAGFRGGCAATQPVMTPEFFEAAGDAAEGWAFGTALADPEKLPAAKKFVTAYRAAYGSDPIELGTAESYDALGLVAQGLGALPAPERGALTRALRAHSYQGVTRTYDFYPSNGSVTETTGLYLWRAEGRKARFLGRFQDVTA